MKYCQHCGRHHRRYTPEPSEPTVYFGEFQGRKLSELSDEELNRFIRSDAMFQSRPAPTPLFASMPSLCHDESQYWFGRYELERRKPEFEREAGASLDIAATDTNAEIAWKLMLYGYRAASRKYHPDRGGNVELMKRLNAAREHARKHLGQR